MKRSIGLAFLSIALVFLYGCTSDKRINELAESIKNMEARLQTIEKVIMPAAQEEPQAQQAAYDIPVDDSYLLGDEGAKVHIVVFSNFQCPYCAKADKALRDLLNDSELKGKINIVFKHFPFDRHEQARPAAKAALAAGEQGKFWQMAEKIFAHQDSLSAKNYQKWAKEVGCNTAKFNNDLKNNDKKYDAIIDKDILLGAEKAHLQGTPWILVNGWLLEGGINAESVKKMIQEKNLESAGNVDTMKDQNI